MGNSNDDDGGAGGGAIDPSGVAGGAAGVDPGMFDPNGGGLPAGDPGTDGDSGADQMSTESDILELKTKVAALVTRNFGGDYQRAFTAYDANQDGGIDRDELIQLLTDAGVGNRLTRGRWASAIIARLDGNGDGKISWDEFNRGIR